MSFRRFCWVLLVAWSFPAALKAEMLPSFRLEHSAWDATDIVLATQTGLDAGRVQVLEVWKGSLRAGEQIGVLGLATFASGESRAVNTSEPFEARGVRAPIHVTGQRLVLFLKKGSGASPEWQPPTDWGDPYLSTGVATVWIEGDKAYSFMQWSNPGPSELRDLSTSLAGLKTGVYRVLELQARLSDALRIDDLTQRIRRLAPFAATDHWEARREGLAALAACGDAAVPTFHAMLEDSGLHNHESDIIEAIGKVGGECAGRELLGILRTETAFWERNAPALQPGWRNGNGFADRSGAELFRDHSTVTLVAARALRSADYHGDMGAVVALRNYWVSLPQLGGGGRPDPLTEECDLLLRLEGMNGQ